MPLERNVVEDVAIERGACIRPIQLRSTDTVTGQVERTGVWLKDLMARIGHDYDARRDMFHVMRHTAASARPSAGLGIPAVAALLGDTEAIVLKTYAHLMPDDRDRARKVIEAFFEAGSAPDVPIRPR